MLSRRVRALLAAIVSAVCLAFAGAAPAHAAYTLDLQKAAPSAAPAGTTQANAFTDFEINMAFDAAGEDTKQLVIDMPKGALATLSSAAVCPKATYQQNSVDACPANSQVGEVNVTAKATVLGVIPIDAEVVGKMYRIPAEGTEVARLGIAMKSSLSTETIHSPTGMRVRDDNTYGIRATTATDLPTEACGITLLLGGCAPITLTQMNMKMFERVVSSGEKGFFFNPPECGAATTVVRATSYNGSVVTKQASYNVTGCEQSVFAPTVEFEPNPAAAARPEELAVRTSQQFDATAAGVSAPFKRVIVTMPQGASLTGASNSDGKLVGCTDAQFDQTSQGPASCPAGSDVGRVLMDSPLVGEVHGRIYLAGAAPGHPDNLFQLFFLAEMPPAPGSTPAPGEHPLRVKLRANVRVDQGSGRLIAELVDLPAQPVRHFVMTFRAGDASAAALRHLRRRGGVLLLQPRGGAH